MTIELTEELAAAVAEAARRRLVSPEQLVLEALRATFAAAPSLADPADSNLSAAVPGASSTGRRPADEVDPVTAEYMKHVDRSLLRENLKLTHEQRLLKLSSMAAFVTELRRAGQAARAAKP